MENTKKCPFCGAEIKIGAKKCRFCGKWLEPIDVNEDNNIQEIASCQNNLEGNDVAGRLMNYINNFKNSHIEPSKYVFLWDEIPQDVLSFHIKKYAKLENDEEALMVINKCNFGAFSTIPTSMVITNRNIYCRLLNDSFFTTFFPKLHFYKFELSQIKSMSIGNHDHCFGSAYEGHQLIVNGSVIGLLRMGMKLEWDENMINELGFIWKAFNN